MTKVLIVDDSKFALGLLTKAINKFDSSLEIDAFGSGADALDSVATNGSPDFAIVDYNMPEMNGIELAERLVKSMPAKRVSLLTAESGFEDNAALKPPADVGVLAKPITERKLAAFLNEDG